jgi:hypothetical protein
MTSWRGRHIRAISPRGFLEPDDRLNVVKKVRIPGLRNTQHSEEDAHGYHHAPHHCTSNSTARWRRLVRPWTLVLRLGLRFMQPVLDAWAAGKVDFLTTTPAAMARRRLMNCYRMTAVEHEPGLSSEQKP